MTFDEWWKAGTSTKVPLYGEANAKKAWDYQQARINELERQALIEHPFTTAEWRRLEGRIRVLRRHLDNIKVRSYELGQRELHDMALSALLPKESGDE
jgi:hypothetical protein